jgi:hypothetical protein
MNAGVDVHGATISAQQMRGRRAFAAASAVATGTPAFCAFRRTPIAVGDAMETGLFRCEFSNPLVSSGTAKAKVVVAVRRVVVVPVRSAHVTRVVDPRPAAHDAIRSAFSTDIRRTGYNSSSAGSTG